MRHSSVVMATCWVCETCSPPLRETMAARTRCTFPRWIPSHPTFHALLSGLRANDWIPFRFFCFGNWFLRVDGSWEDYLRKRSANLRSAIRRRGKRFAADGGTLQIVTNPEHLSSTRSLNSRQIYSASWKKPEPYPDFVPALIRRLASQGNAPPRNCAARGTYHCSATVDRRPPEGQHLQGGVPRAICVLLSRERYLPRTCCSTASIRDHVQEVDFLIGDDRYKRMWMSDRRERWGIVAYNPRTLIGCALLLKEIAGRSGQDRRGSISPSRLASEAPHLAKYGNEKRPTATRNTKEASGE
jgi:hypothetical protein